MGEENSKKTADDTTKEVIIRQNISGGIIPLQREWVFYTNGDIRQPNGDVFVLTEEQLNDILDRFKSFESEKIENTYTAPIGSADFRTLELTMIYEDGIRKIIIEDSNDQVPEVFWQYWDYLQDLAKKGLDKKK